MNPYYDLTDDEAARHALFASTDTKDLGRVARRLANLER